MKFKIDENLPREYASILRDAGFSADTVADERAEPRTRRPQNLVTLQPNIDWPA